MVEAVDHFIRLSIEWARTYASASQRKLRRRQVTSCTSFVPSYSALIGTGVSYSTWIKRRYIFSMSTKKTLELVEKKTIHICTLTNDTRRATVAVTIAGDGTVLPSTIIFKGKHDRRIARSEFGTYPAGHHYCCQEAAWINEQVMLA